jgi:hypothetical protein
MDTTLVIVTVLSMSMAAALSAIVWRMLRLERQRSNARVAVLTTLAHAAPARPAAVPDRPARPVLIDLPITSPSAATPGRETPAIAPLFTAPEQVSPWGPRFAVMTAGALIVTSIVLFSLAAHAPTPARGVASTSASVSGGRQASATAGAGGLELLSLRDTRQPGSLTITGLVQNPRNGAALTRIAVTAYTFDGNGSFLASGRALIDVTALAPGGESPFTVTVAVSDAVARYRIGFRDEAGQVIPHVDRRQPGPIAELRVRSGPDN